MDDDDTLDDELDELALDLVLDDRALDPPEPSFTEMFVSVDIARGLRVKRRPSDVTRVTLQVDGAELALTIAGEASTSSVMVIDMALARLFQERRRTHWMRRRNPHLGRAVADASELP